MGCSFGRADNRRMGCTVVGSFQEMGVVVNEDRE